LIFVNLFLGFENVTRIESLMAPFGGDWLDEGSLTIR